ncbi:hypothetical protein, partial [Staphylococcus aureus]
LFVLSLLIIEVIALFLYSKSKNRTDENFSISPIYYRTEKSKHKERWLGEVKTFESDETRKERNEFSRAK